MVSPATRTAPPASAVGGSAVSAARGGRGRRRVVIGTVASLALLVVGVAASLFVGARAVDPAVVWSVLAALPAQLLTGGLSTALAPGSGAGMDEVVVAARVPLSLIHI